MPGPSKSTLFMVQCALVVQPFYAFTSELYPERVRNQGRLELAIRNTGNVHSTNNIEAKDREQALKFSIEGGRSVHRRPRPRRKREPARRPA